MRILRNLVREIIQENLITEGVQAPANFEGFNLEGDVVLLLKKGDLTVAYARIIHDGLSVLKIVEPFKAAGTFNLSAVRATPGMNKRGALSSALRLFIEDEVKTLQSQTGIRANFFVMSDRPKSVYRLNQNVFYLNSRSGGFDIQSQSPVAQNNSYTIPDDLLTSLTQAVAQTKSGKKIDVQTVRVASIDNRRFTAHTFLEFVESGLVIDLGEVITKLKQDNVIIDDDTEFYSRLEVSIDVLKPYIQKFFAKKIPNGRFKLSTSSITSKPITKTTLIAKIVKDFFEGAGDFKQPRFTCREATNPSMTELSIPTKETVKTNPVYKNGTDLFASVYLSKSYLTAIKSVKDDKGNALKYDVKQYAGLNNFNRPTLGNTITLNVVEKDGKFYVKSANEDDELYLFPANVIAEYESAFMENFYIISVQFLTYSSSNGNFWLANKEVNFSLSKFGRTVYDLYNDPKFDIPVPPYTLAANLQDDLWNVIVEQIEASTSESIKDIMPGFSSNAAAAIVDKMNKSLKAWEAQEHKRK